MKSKSELTLLLSGLLTAVISIILIILFILVYR